MVKNVKGGKGHKNLARKYNNVALQQTSVRIKKEEGELYGVVSNILGHGHFYVMCEDDKKRICRIGGKFKKRRRDNTVVTNGFVMIGLYEYETTSSKKANDIEKCELMEVYSDSDVKCLYDKEKDADSKRFIQKAINQQALTNNKSSSSSSSSSSCKEAAVDSGFDFLSEDEMNQRIAMEEQLKIRSSGAIEGGAAIDETETTEGYINFDDI
jgi:initiation factor 1A